MKVVNPADFLIRAMPVNSLSCPASDFGCCVNLVEEAFYRATKALGFLHVRYTCWVQDIAKSQIDGYSFSINFSDFPADWEREYETQRYYETDPLLYVLSNPDAPPLVYGTWASARKAAENNPPGCDDNAHAKYKAGIEKLFERATSFGINSGIYMMLNVGIRRLVISLASSKNDAELDEVVDVALYQKILAAVVLCDQSLALTNTCARCAKSLRIAGGPSIKLTPMQTRILQSFAADSTATIANVAALNNLTTNTVNFHLKSIREKFSKKSASGHALSAIAREHGLI